jgi:oligopeptide/dipeptide ABC transporter ATP-binding protein
LSVFVGTLDVSIQAQIINLLMDLQQKLSLTYLFISHDLRIVSSISNHIAVMYLGKIVEMGISKILFSMPRHPYTRSLLNSIPAAGPNNRGKRTILYGDIPSPMNPPSGCRFHTRCSSVQDICRQQEPILKGNEEHLCAYHFFGEI